MERASWLLTLALIVGGCASSDGTPSGTKEPIEEEDDDSNADGDDDEDDDSGDDDDDDTPPTKPPKSDSTKADAGSKADSSVKADAGNSTGTGSGGAGLPCDLAPTIAKKCADCHQGSGRYGAPMPLEDWDDFQAKDKKGRAYHEVALLKVTGKEGNAMPPATHALTPDEKTKLVSWLTAKAPKSTATCEGSSQPDPKSPETDDQEIEDCDIELEFRAGHDKPYKVPTTPDYYMCFYFKPDFKPETVGKGFLPLIDNDKVIHHWLLFVKKDASKRAGTSEQCTGVNPGATLIAGWAPGGQNTTAPTNVGIDLPKGPDVIYQLELHYNNTVGPEATDRSGVKLCATNKPQKEMAAIHYLGSENILILPGTTGTAGSTCRPKAPVTLLSVNPHMHKTGSYAKMVITRKNGMQEIYHDAPFSFESQINYRKTAKLEVGDTITSTCTFKNDSSSVKVFQEGTNDEMCYLFTLAYPIGAMDTGSDLLGVGLPGPNRCMK